MEKVVQKEISYEDISIESNYYVYEKQSVKEKEKEKDIIFGKRGFWLASSGVYGNDSGAVFGPGAVSDGSVYSGGGDLFVSYGGWHAVGMSMRPVGVLESDIPIKDLPIFEIVIPTLRIKLS